MFKPDVTSHKCPLSAFTPHLYTRMEGTYYRSSAFLSKKILYNIYPKVDL